jgi:hypothetical protein
MPSRGAAQEEIVRFQSVVSSHQTFREPIGHGLVFILAPTGDGWEINIAPQKPPSQDCDAFVTAVNLPLRSYNALQLNPSYGNTAKQAVAMSPREFNFVLNCAASNREWTFLMRVDGSLPATEKQEADALAKRLTSPHGYGRLWIQKYKISAAPQEIEGKTTGQIDSIHFRVEIRFPQNADSLPVPNDYQK